MLNQYGRRYLARLQTLLKEFHELDAAGSNAHIGAKNKLDGFIVARTLIRLGIKDLFHL
jgi:hypothetical protein